MSSRLKDFQFFIYLIFLTVSVIVLVISMNDVIFHDSSLSTYFLTFSSLGNWDYWILALSLIFSIIFFYFIYRNLFDMRKFEELVTKGSKYNFVRSIKELQTISRRLGPRYERRLSEAMEKFKIK